MKMDHDIEGNGGRGKYALLLLRKLTEYDDGKTFGGVSPKIAAALQVLEDAGIVDWGIVGTESEFFVMRLKDKYAYGGMVGYIREVEAGPFIDREYAAALRDMALRSGPHSKFCKEPD